MAGSRTAARPASGLADPPFNVAVAVPGQLTVRDANDNGARFRLYREAFDLPVIARFTVHGTPVPKARARVVLRDGKPRSYTPAETREAEETVADWFRIAAPRHVPDKGHAYGLMAVFFTPSLAAGDGDNYTKLIKDALNGIAWPDDRQVIEDSNRVNLVAPERARSEVMIYRAGDLQRFTLECARPGCTELFEVSPFTRPEARQRYCSRPCAASARRRGPQAAATGGAA